MSSLRELSQGISYFYEQFDPVEIGKSKKFKFLNDYVLTLILVLLAAELIGYFVKLSSAEAAFALFMVVMIQVIYETSEIFISGKRRADEFEKTFNEMKSDNTNKIIQKAGNVLYKYFKSVVVTWTIFLAVYVFLISEYIMITDLFYRVLYLIGTVSAIIILTDISRKAYMRLHDDLEESSTQLFFLKYVNDITVEFELGANSSESTKTTGILRRIGSTIFIKREDGFDQEIYFKTIKSISVKEELKKEQPWIV
jgi:hypothetical protein